MSGLSFACQLNLNVGGIKPKDSQATTFFSQGSSQSWLRRPAFEANRKIAWELLMRHLIVVLGLTLHVNRCSLARATGLFFSHGSFYLVKVNGRLREVRSGTIK